MKNKLLLVCMGSLLIWGYGAMSIAAELTSIAVTPSSSVINAGQAKQYTAIGTFSTGATQVLAGTFSASGTMVATRKYDFNGDSTATDLGNGKILIAGGGNVIAELYDIASGTFRSTGSMNAVRSYPTATLLRNGKVLIAGGNLDGAGLNSAELYNPVTRTFTPTGSMSTNRFVHSATLIGNGKVLIVAGWTSLAAGVTTEAQTNEIYDPATGTFSDTGPLIQPRYAHTATLLNNGKVLIAGGWVNPSTGAIANAELYDPVAGQFTAAPPMTIAMAYRTATLLGNGKVLIVGGDDGSEIGTNQAELYDPIANTFITIPTPMTAPHFGHTAIRLANGQILISGGKSGTDETATAELYDPVLNTFSVTTGPMTTSRNHHTATDLGNGKVLLAGGALPSTPTELYTLGATWSSRDANVAPINSTTGLVSSGKKPGTITITATSGSINGRTTLLNAGSDLIVTTASSGATTVKRGRTFTFSASTKNLGNAASTEATNTGLYLATGTTSTLVGSISIPSGLAAGSTSTAVRMKVTVPSTLGPGTYSLRAIADYTATQVELNEDNNAFTGGTITVR